MEKNIIEIDASPPDFIAFDFVLHGVLKARLSLFLM
jgi:hypothetical protein